MNKTTSKAFSVTEGMILLVIVGLILAIVVPISIRVLGGAGVFGPTRIQEVTVQRLYVDVAQGEHGGSHYMVGTDKGVFEISNGLLLGVWNADELYSTLKEGRRFTVTTEGNKVVGFWAQSYPYITSVSPAP